MPHNMLVDKIEKKIAALQKEQGSIIVLKGIPLTTVSSVDANVVDLEKLSENKLAYFIELTKSRSIITYEEFLLLGEFIVAQYNAVFILNNNIYMEQYPLDLYCSDAVKKGLLTHFKEVEDDLDDEEEVGNIDDFISLYVGLKEYHGFLLGAYCDDKLPSSTKIIFVNLFENSAFSVPKVDHADDFIDIIEEPDYIDFVRKLFNEPEELCVRISNYTGDSFALNAHLRILAENWADWVDISILQPQSVSNDFNHRDAYTDILKKYWGYDSFRTIPVYNMAALEEGEKKIDLVSQESVIANLVEQVENCAEKGEDYRDIFTTAPTGAGKSVMFQIPAIYLAEKYNLLTIVISPLIGLMNDQVKNLELKNYRFAKTINSDISPIIKQDIMDKVSASEYHILYLSPETLLSRSDVEQLIGDRTIGMIVVDEAHIVTTWGKQFRPDYWYLGDHIRKLRRRQLERKGRSFVVATFTATAIFHGLEDMYTETINSLHMLNPITYLGYVKRNDIDIVIKRPKKEKGARREYELDKFADIESVIKRALITNKKTLIYFPTVALINRCYEYLYAERMASNVAIYHGSLNRDQKAESYERFMSGEKLAMLATKAFGMGIDINDIELVVHFAPTGNVCDYVQEIGRAARREDIQGEAYYAYDSRDFKHINRLHGLSTIQKYQLVEVIKKINELYTNSLKNGGRQVRTRRRNAMLLDAENFSYIFGSPVGDEDSNINKVKTALLIIQKDFENKLGFSPITIRPIPLFSVGFFEIEPNYQKQLLKKYPECLEEIESQKHICRVLLEKIWRKDYENHSLPQFKYMLYSRDPEMELVRTIPMYPTLCVSIEFSDDYDSVFERCWSAIRGFVKKSILSGSFIALSEMAAAISEKCNMSKYKAHTICEVIIASMDSYRRNFAKGSTPIATERVTVEGNVKYQFNVAVNSYFAWVEKNYKRILQDTKDGELYLVNDNATSTKEAGVVLGVLEAMDVLSFKMIGGANSQLYIYINQIQSLKNIINNPYSYKNRLLESVSERHKVSVQMLSYLYESDFSSDEMWNILEDYFLGVIPERVKRECLKENPDMLFD